MLRLLLFRCFAHKKGKCSRFSRPYQNAGTKVPNSYIFNPAVDLQQLCVKLLKLQEPYEYYQSKWRRYMVTDHQVAYTTRNETGILLYWWCWCYRWTRDLNHMNRLIIKEIMISNQALWKINQRCYLY